jgi:hypothetical protein
MAAEGLVSGNGTGEVTEEFEDRIREPRRIDVWSVSCEDSLLEAFPSTAASRTCRSELGSSTLEVLRIVISSGLAGSESSKSPGHSSSDSESFPKTKQQFWQSAMALRIGSFGQGLVCTPSL